MDKSISTISLDVGYKDSNPVVKNINITVNKGEIVALIGCNGAGKTTILKTIVRQIEKLNGNIRIYDRDEAELSNEEIARQISIVMTERIHPEYMSCYEVVATGRYPYTGRLGVLGEDDKRIIKDAIELVGAKDVADKDYTKVSDGQRQRVMLARAIAQDTDVMILDEPTSFLDIQYKLDILSIIQRLARDSKKAVIMSMHELEFVAAVADKIVAVADDKIFKIGTPKEILTGNNLSTLYDMDCNKAKILADSLERYSEALKECLK